MFAQYQDAGQHRAIHSSRLPQTMVERMSRYGDVGFYGACTQFLLTILFIKITHFRLSLLVKE